MKRTIVNLRHGATMKTVKDIEAYVRLREQRVHLKDDKSIGVLPE